MTAVTGCLLMVLFGVCSYDVAFSGFSNSICMLMASAMIVGIAMFKTGVASWVGNLAIRFSGGKEKKLLFWMCVIGGLLSMFIANTAIIAVFIPIIESVAEESGGKISRLRLVLPMALAVMIGGASTLVGCTPQLTANGILKSLTGEEMTMWTLTAPAACIFLLYLLYVSLAGDWIGRRVFQGRTGKSMEHSAHTVGRFPNRAARRKAALMVVILIFMIASYMIGWIPVTYTAMISAICCIVTGCCSVKDVVRELQWETVVFLASCLGLAEALTVSGAGERIGFLVSALLGEVHSPFIIFAAVVLLTLVLSQFITNSTAIIISLPIGFSLCAACGMQFLPLCIGVTLAASVACCTPLAAAQITMTQVAGYAFSDYLRYCFLPSVIMYVGILLFVPLFYPLTG